MKVWKLLAMILLTGCAATKPWTVPADLTQGNADNIVMQAAANGQLSQLLERAEATLLDTDEPRMAEFLRAALKSDRLSESDRSTAEWMLHDVCERNAPGTVAADFRFATAERSENRLHTFRTGEPLLMVLYDPDCDHCREVIAELAAMQGLPEVLAICVESPASRWEQTRDLLPQQWTKGFDRSDVLGNDLYIVRSLPSVYLLDGERRVILKNPSVQQLSDHLGK